jgi:purine catabolism regulator
MALTVRDALKIGRLVDAKILAGAAGLDNIIRAVDIIDVPDAAIWFRKDSLLSTTFYALKDNLDAQLQMLEDITQCGGAALIIFSPERYISHIDERLIQRADDLNLPLLQMPDCSYIDVIVPVMTEILDKQVEALEYAQEVHNRMTDFVLKGKSLQQLITSLSLLINHTVIMVDAELALLNYELISESGVHTPLINRLTESQGYLELTACYPPEIMKRMLNGKKPLYHLYGKNDGLDFLFPIIASDTFYGILIIPGLEQELEPAKTVALEAASVAIALNILKERAIQDAERKSELDFFNELLLGNLKSREMIIAQAKQIGLEVDGPYCLILVELNKESSYYRKLLQKSSTTKESLEKKLHRLLRITLQMQNAKCIIAEALGSFMVLLRLSDKWSVDERIHYSKSLMVRLKKAVQARMEDAPVCMAMGGIYDNIERISASYMQAWETMDIGKKILPSDFAVCHTDLEAYHLVKRFLTSSSAANLYEQVYDKLLKYDREKSGELVHTLECYIENNYSRTKTAEQLHIHRNSLNYRLQQINKLLGQDVDEIDSLPFLLASVSRKLSP